jgi:hypothetical protein
MPGSDILGAAGIARISMKLSKQQQSEKARVDRHRCREWLIEIMREGHPKFCTKAEFFRIATAAFGVSKAAFDGLGNQRDASATASQALYLQAVQHPGSQPKQPNKQ